MSSETNPNEISINVVSDEKKESNPPEEGLKFSEMDVEDVSKLLDLEKQKTSEYEEKLKLVLADFQNLDRKTQTDIRNGINTKIDEFVLDFLKI